MQADRIYRPIVVARSICLVAAISGARDAIASTQPAPASAGQYDCGNAYPATQPRFDDFDLTLDATTPAEPDSDVASIDEDVRFVPTARPIVPEPQHPPLSTHENVDTGKPFHEWQRASDDWLGLRPALDDHGIDIQSNLTTDYSFDFRGAVQPHASALRSLLNISFALDTERLLDLKGGTFYVNFQKSFGDNGSADIPSLQAVDSLDAPSGSQISEVWYEQKFLDDKARIKFGKIDASSEFAATKAAAAFLNASFSESPTILGFPAYPDTAFGGNIFVNPNPHVYAGFGVYDGASHEGFSTGSRGPATLFGPPSDLFLIGEAGVKWTITGNLPGRWGVGYWHHTGTFERFDGGTIRGASGPYVILDQAVWRANPADNDDARGVDVSFQYGHADSQISPVVDHIGVGATWTGIVPRRESDMFGVGLTWVRPTDDSGSTTGHAQEVAGEVFYTVQLLKWLSIKPDLQFIHNPAGAGRGPDAIVATVRLSIDF